MRNTARSLTLLTFLLLGTKVAAQDAGDAQSNVASQRLPPRVLKAAVSAEYPVDVELRVTELIYDLLVSAEGRVLEAKLAAPPELSVEAAERVRKATEPHVMSLELAPAMDGDKPIAARVRYALKLPPLLPPTPTATADAGIAQAVDAGLTTQTPLAQLTDAAVVDASTLPSDLDAHLPTPPIVEAPHNAVARINEPVQATSSITLQGASLRRRLILNTGDLLNGAPGFYVVQHGGGGKAQQYFLRGFDADHGTDVALFVDGVPVNLPTHGHGSGYSELQWVIPELVEKVEVRKGPFFSELGDRAVAGAVNFRLASELPESFVTFQGGSFNTLRGVAAVAPRTKSFKPILAAEVFKSDGPFKLSDDYRRFSLFGRASYEHGNDVLRVTGQSFASQWHASGQIPLRAVKAGTLSRFGAVDPYEGGANQRHSIAIHYEHKLSANECFIETAYLTRSQLTLYSNFGLYAGDTEEGDMIRQNDVRTFVGSRTQYIRSLHHDKWFVTLRTGPQVRYDAGRPSVEHAPRRIPTERLIAATVNQLEAGAFLEADLRYASWLRLVAGGRWDAMAVQVRNRLAELGESDGGQRFAQIVSPKLSAIFHVPHDIDLFANFGSGFHSNDARGVVLLPPNRVDPLARALAYELGARYALDKLLTVSASGYVLTLESETVFVGDDGTSEPRGSTRRLGGELDVRFSPLSWLSFDANTNYSHATFVDNAGNGAAVALAPTWLAQAGAEVVHPIGVSGRLTLVYIADRPATEDSELTAEGFTRLDANVGYKTKRYGVELSMQNLTDAIYRQAQFAGTTRLKDETSAAACTHGSRAIEGENGQFVGCEDITFTPGMPFTVLASGSVYF